jgi:hypothetical protein
MHKKHQPEHHRRGQYHRSQRPEAQTSQREQTEGGAEDQQMQAPMQRNGKNRRPRQPRTLQKEQQPDGDRCQPAEQRGAATCAGQQRGERHGDGHRQRKLVGTEASDRVHGGAYRSGAAPRCGKLEIF